MKTLPTVAAGTLVAFLALFILLSSVAAASVSLTLNGLSFTGTQTITISGTATPAPGAGQSAFVQVTNPSGRAVAAASVPVDATAGTFSYSFASGGTSLWVTGTYTVTASAGGASGSTSFTYTCTANCGAPTTGGAASTAILVDVRATSPAWPGQPVTIGILTSSAANGSLIEAIFQTVHYHSPGGGLTTLCTPTAGTGCAGTFTRIHIGFYEITFTLPATTADGSYDTHAWVNNGNNQQGQGLAAFTVSSAIATSASQNSILTAITSMQATVTALPGQVTAALSTVTGSLSSIQTAATAAQTAANAAQQAASGVAANVSSTLSAAQSSQTYVLVVAALAAITLVLELAILVRKLS